MVQHTTDQPQDVAGTESLPTTGSLGLSTAHISPRRVFEAHRGSFLARVYDGGNLTVLERSGTSRRGGGLRGEITGFSGASRRRLQRAIEALDRRKLTAKRPLEAGLTYPETWPRDPKTWKRQLDAFSKTVRRRYPKAFVFWRLELQDRGAPHFHLLAFNVHRIPHEWLAETWYRIVASADPQHLVAGTHVDRVRNWRHMRAYIGKYLAKVEMNMRVATGFGRVWGILNRERYTEALTEVLAEVPSEVFYRVRRIFARYLNAEYRQRGGRFRLKSKFDPGGLGVFLRAELAFKILQVVVA